MTDERLAAIEQLLQARMTAIEELETECILFSTSKRRMDFAQSLDARNRIIEKARTLTNIADSLTTLMEVKEDSLGGTG